MTSDSYVVFYSYPKVDDDFMFFNTLKEAEHWRDTNLDCWNVKIYKWVA